MNTNSSLISIGNFDFKLNHLLVIGILILSFSISFLLRSQPADYGFELNEFDPFFNYRATQYVVDNGINEYFEWNDDLSWYPHGRDVSSNSQVTLHLTAAVTYWIFGGGSESFDNETGSCEEMLGLFSCATYSAKAGDFITVVKNGEIHLNVCPGWCSRLFRACSTSWCDGMDTAEQCCKSLNPSSAGPATGPGTWATMKEDTSKPNNGCYSNAHYEVPSSHLWLLVVASLVANLA